MKEQNEQIDPMEHLDLLTEEQQEMLKRVVPYIKEGMPRSQAEKKAGTYPGFYWYARNQVTKKLSKSTPKANKTPSKKHAPKIIQYTVPDSEVSSDTVRVCVLRGNSSDIRNIMDTLKGVWE